MNDFTVMSHESHGQCFCGVGAHCRGGVECDGPPCIASGKEQNDG